MGWTRALVPPQTPGMLGTDLARAYLGDVGATLTAAQTMGITVPANGTIDVVV